MAKLWRSRWHPEKGVWTLNKDTRTECIRHIKIQGNTSDNEIGRFKEAREWEKWRKGKKGEKPILKEYRNYNFIGSHECSEGKTQAEARGRKSEERTSGQLWFETHAIVWWTTSPSNEDLTELNIAMRFPSNGFRRYHMICISHELSILPSSLTAKATYV